MRAMKSGRDVRINVRKPKALGECDRCGFWHLHANMRRQFQWAGNTLRDTGLLVGLDCLDVPQQQLRSIILPADPLPIINARPSPNITPATAVVGGPLPTSPDNQGFTVFTLGLVAPPAVAVTPPPPPPAPAPSLDFSKATNSMYFGLI